MILALEQGGHPVSGLRAYERCRAVLARELGCSPGSTAVRSSRSLTRWPPAGIRARTERRLGRRPGPVALRVSWDSCEVAMPHPLGATLWKSW